MTPHERKENAQHYNGGGGFVVCVFGGKKKEKRSAHNAGVLWRGCGHALHRPLQRYSDRVSCTLYDIGKMSILRSEHVTHPA